MKLYVEDSSNIWMKDINGADASIVVENANPKGMAVDWIGRRIFWAEYISRRISVANLDGKERRVVTNTLGYPRAIAIDSLSGFLFWTEQRVIMRFNLVDGIKVTLVSYYDGIHVIRLDCRLKRIYFLEYSSTIRYIKSCDYGGKKKKTIAGGPFRYNLLGVMGDSLYLWNTNEYRIKEMNVSSGNITREILLKSYHFSADDLTLIDESLQPTATKGCPGSRCPRFSYCNQVTGLCQCEVGFEKDGSRCADIDECLSSPCAGHPNTSCKNFQGSYECSCDKGFLSEKTNNTCIANSDLQIKLVNSKSNRTKRGTIMIYHPSFGWGTICALERWTDAEGAVVCRHLGFTGVKAVRTGAYYGEGSGRILLENVHCTGKESYIWECPRRQWYAPLACLHWYDAGVACY